MTRFLCLSLALAAVPLIGCGGSKHPTDSSSSKDTGYDQAVKFSQCMRSHGLASFPDPVRRSGGGVSLTMKKGSGPDPGSQQFKTAQAACRKFAPRRDGGKAMTAAEQQQFLRYSQCIRTHGVPQFPDPTFSDGGVDLRFPRGLGPDSPRLQAAQRACRSLQPGEMGGDDGGARPAGG
jgi:hypothetical protein